MEEVSPNNPNIPQEQQNPSTHILNVNELQNKDKQKFVAIYWYDKLSYLIAIGLFISILLGGMSFLSDSVSFLMFLTPLPPTIAAAIWLIKRLFHGKDLDPIKKQSY